MENDIFQTNFVLENDNYTDNTVLIMYYLECFQTATIHLCIIYNISGSGLGI